MKRTTHNILLSLAGFIIFLPLAIWYCYSYPKKVVVVLQIHERQIEKSYDSTQLMDKVENVEKQVQAEIAEYLQTSQPQVLANEGYPEDVAETIRLYRYMNHALQQAREMAPKIDQIEHQLTKLAAEEYLDWVITSCQQSLQGAVRNSADKYVIENERVIPLQAEDRELHQRSSAVTNQLYALHSAEDAIFELCMHEHIDGFFAACHEITDDAALIEWVHKHSFKHMMGQISNFLDGTDEMGDKLMKQLQLLNLSSPFNRAAPASAEDQALHDEIYEFVQQVHKKLGEYYVDPEPDTQTDLFSRFFGKYLRQCGLAFEPVLAKKIEYCEKLNQQAMNSDDDLLKLEAKHCQLMLKYPDRLIRGCLMAEKEKLLALSDKFCAERSLVSLKMILWQMRWGLHREAVWVIGDGHRESIEAAARTLNFDGVEFYTPPTVAIPLQELVDP
ncbi:hypothetical protein ACFL2B_03180 [Patescibacteria group bacterium]